MHRYTRKNTHTNPSPAGAPGGARLGRTQRGLRCLRARDQRFTPQVRGGGVRGQQERAVCGVGRAKGPVWAMPVGADREVPNAGTTPLNSQGRDGWTCALKYACAVCVIATCAVLGRGLGGGGAAVARIIMVTAGPSFDSPTSPRATSLTAQYVALTLIRGSGQGEGGRGRGGEGGGVEDACPKGTGGCHPPPFLFRLPPCHAPAPLAPSTLGALHIRLGRVGGNLAAAPQASPGAGQARPHDLAHMLSNAICVTLPHSPNTPRSTASHVLRGGSGEGRGAGRACSRPEQRSQGQAGARSRTDNGSRSSKGGGTMAMAGRRPRTAGEEWRAWVGAAP